MSDSARPVRAAEPLVLGAFDVRGFVVAVRGLDDTRIADAVDALYLAIDEMVNASGGRVVKFIGDGALAVWPPDRADDALGAMIELRERALSALDPFGIRGDLICRMHHGEVVAGEFGPKRTYDVIGKDVFLAFTLPARTLSVSAEAFRKLGDEARSLLKKHTEPIVYIPVGDPRP
ncbi:MAG TPA: adenylate/guanylate cyclase domain-containing protein [Acidimicrobiia bacterium]|nr:adenylate/guanylate cyclase domain-containing protein [Acidimicrobiia bacterium]